jgi:hypothetical protein
MRKFIKGIKARHYEARMDHCQRKVRKAADIPTTNYWIDMYWMYNERLLNL